jgi:hypothetical protein
MPASSSSYAKNNARYSSSNTARSGSTGSSYAGISARSSSSTTAHPDARSGYSTISAASSSSYSSINTPFSSSTAVGLDAAYGLTLKAMGGYLDRPRVFDTSNPGVTEYGDPDLGSPYELCSPSGTGTGVGGQPKDGDKSGENCFPLGNAMTIQEVNDNLAIPDDNMDGGSIEFKSEPMQG